MLCKKVLECLKDMRCRFKNLTSAREHCVLCAEAANAIQLGLRINWPFELISTIFELMCQHAVNHCGFINVFDICMITRLQAFLPRSIRLKECLSQLGPYVGTADVGGNRIVPLGCSLLSIRLTVGGAPSTTVHFSSPSLDRSGSCTGIKCWEYNVHKSRLLRVSPEPEPLDDVVQLIIGEIVLIVNSLELFLEMIERTLDEAFAVRSV